MTLPGFTYTDAVDGMTGASAAFQNNIGDNLQIIANSINRSATFTVAASNSSTADKNVADYLCTGTNDDVTINSAITAANALGGGIVQLCAGTFTIGTGGVQLKSNVTLAGVGMGTQIMIANNVGSAVNAIIAPSYSNVVARDLYINCNKANEGQTTQGIVFNGTQNFLISNVKIDGAKSGYGIVTDASSGPGLIQGCYVSNCDQDDIRLYGSRTRVVGCYLSGSGSPFCGIISEGQYNVILGNNCTGNAYGIRVYMTSNNTVTGNVVDSSNICGINIYGSYNEVASNIVMGSSSTMASIVLTGYATYTNNTITGNMISGNAGGDGILVNSNSNIVTGNTISNNAMHGIELNGCSDCVVVGNNCWGNGTSSNNTYANIGLTGSATYCNIQANTCRLGGNMNKPGWGIKITDSTNQYNMVTNNNLHNSGQTANFTDSGTGTISSAGNYTT